MLSAILRDYANTIGWEIPSQLLAVVGDSEELARRIKEGTIPIISDVPGFKAYYVMHAPALQTG